MTSPHYRAVAYSIIVALGGLIFGLDAVLISGGEAQIQKEFGLSQWGIGFVVSSPGLGVLVALPIAGWIGNALGRKKALLGVAFLYILSAVWSAIAGDWMQLWAARLLGGLAFTSLSFAPMYIGEIAPSRWRGKLVTICQINTVIGLSGAYFVNLAIQNGSANGGAAWAQAIGLDAENSWRYMLGSEILPAVVWFVLMLIITESPRWLVSQGRDADAERALRRLVPEEEVADQLQEIQHGLQNETKGLPVATQVARLFGSGLRLAVIVGATIAIAQQATGINAIYFYAPRVFKQLGYDQNAAFYQAAIMGAISLLFAVLALFVVDRVGRRPVALFGFLWIIASLGLCAYGFHQATYELSEEALQNLPAEVQAELAPLVGTTYGADIEFKEAATEILGEQRIKEHEAALLEAAADLPAGLIVAGLLSFIAAFQFSVGPVMWILLSEIFPTSVRGVAIPLFHFVTGVTSYLVQLLFPVALSTLGAATVFGSFVAIPLVGLIVLAACLPETKNLSIEEIQAAFRRGRSPGAEPAPA